MNQPIMQANRESISKPLPLMSSSPGACVSGGCEMTDAERTALRRKQDVLLMYLRGSFPVTFKISAEDTNSPTISELAEYLYPEYEELIDKQIDLCQRRLI